MTNKCRGLLHIESDGEKRFSTLRDLRMCHRGYLIPARRRPIVIPVNRYRPLYHLERRFEKPHLRLEGWVCVRYRERFKLRLIKIIHPPTNPELHLPSPPLILHRLRPSNQ